MGIFSTQQFLFIMKKIILLPSILLLGLISGIPNIDVDNSLNVKSLGVDEQLKVACDELIKQVDQK